MINDYIELAKNFAESTTRILDTFYYDQAKKPYPSQVDFKKRMERRSRKAGLADDQVRQILIPVHVPPLLEIKFSVGHWFFILLDITTRRIVACDSLRYRDENMKAMCVVSKAIGTVVDIDSSWSQQIEESFPVQKDGTSCGLFTLAAIRSLAKHEQPTKIPYDATTITSLREIIATELTAQYIM